MIGKLTNRLLANFGYEVVKTKLAVTDITNDKVFMKLYDVCKPYTMTSVERMYALYLSLNYIVDNNIDGDFVECGVWKGGSSMLIAEFLASKNIAHRKIFMYDTFEGMSAPTEKDVDIIRETSAEKLLAQNSKEVSDSVWCYSSLDEVKRNMGLTRFNQNNIVYVKGKVEDTIPHTMPNNELALLRLDTDWYESTKHELNHLFPLLQQKGVLIIDDFGHWDGAKKAVLEYFEKNKVQMLLNRIDYTGRIGIKY